MLAALRKRLADILGYSAEPAERPRCLHLDRRIVSSDPEGDGWWYWCSDCRRYWSEQKPVC